MQNLKQSSILASVLFCTGCATSHFRIEKMDKHAAQIAVTPDRVLFECEKLENGGAGFMIHLLNNDKTVVTISQSNTLDLRSCADRVSTLKGILKQSPEVLIGGVGNYSDTDMKIDVQYQFPAGGPFSHSGRGLAFIAMWNKAGRCFGAYSMEEKPCPEDGFPLP